MNVAVREARSFPVAKDFETWIRYGRRRGERLVYYSGLLMNDRQESNTVNELARAVWRAYEQGRIALTQRRVSAECCDYIATAL